MPNRSTTGRRALTALALSIATGVVVAAASPAAATTGCTTVNRGTKARDNLIGTHGHDCLLARAGADVIRPRSGRDVVRAGAGRDIVRARDGQRDIVRCGRGRDRAHVDRHDVARHCERIIHHKSASDSGSHPPPGDACTEGTFSPSNEPGACWRPYSNASPWNTPLGANPSLAPNSAAIVKRLLGFGSISSPVSGNAGTSQDWQHPVYWSKSSDPLYTLRFKYRDGGGDCRTTSWGSTAALEGRQIRIPEAAEPAAGSDHHLTVVDQSTNTAYSFAGYDPCSTGKHDSTDVYVATEGGAENVETGDGRGVAATAGYFPAGAGDIRPAEIEQGEINHALFIEVHCTDVGNVYPADTGSQYGQVLGSTRKCHNAGLPDTNAPHNGQHFYLDYTDAEIDALGVPDWRKTILRAMAHYGMYVGDTGGAPWGLKFESGSSWTSFGLADPWVRLAQRYDLPSHIDDSTGRRFYSWNIASGVDWSRLRVVAP